MNHLDHLPDEQPHADAQGDIDPVDLERAEAEGAELAARGLVRATSSGTHLALIKGKSQPHEDDGPFIVDLT